jgi:hypothetical protein
VGGNGPEVDKVLETSINTRYYRVRLVVTTTCAKWRNRIPLSPPFFKSQPRMRVPRAYYYFCNAERDTKKVVNFARQRNFE